MATKFLVISLLLANILLFGIKLSSDSFTITPVEASTASITRTDLPVISLLAELPAVALQFRASVAQCFSIGPIQSFNEMEKLRYKLAEYTSESQQRTSQAKVDEGYWVYLDVVDSRAHALELANELGSMGLTDYFVMTSGDLENSLSLGLYSDERNARKRQAALRAMGFNARVLSRYKTVEHYWLDYQLAQGSDSPWERLRHSVPTAVQLEVPCSAPPEETVTERMHASN